MTLTISSPIAVPPTIRQDAPPAPASPPRSAEMRRYHGHGQILWEALKALQPDPKTRLDAATPSRVDGRLATSAPLPGGVDRTVDAHLVRPGTIAMTLPANQPAALAAMAGVLLDHRVGLIVDLSDPALSRDHALHAGGHFGIPQAATNVDFARTGESPLQGLPEDVRVSTLKIGLALGRERAPHGGGPIELSCLQVQRVDREDDRHSRSRTGPGIALSPADTMALVTHLQAFRARHPAQAIVVIDDATRRLGGQLIAAEAIAEHHRHLPEGLPRPIGALTQHLREICEPLHQLRGTLMPASEMQATALIGFVDQWRTQASPGTDRPPSAAGLTPPARRARFRREDLPPPPPPPAAAAGLGPRAHACAVVDKLPLRPSDYRIGPALEKLSVNHHSLSDKDLTAMQDAHAKGLTASLESIDQLASRPKRSWLQRLFGRSPSATTPKSESTGPRAATEHGWSSRLRFWR